MKRAIGVTLLLCGAAILYGGAVKFFRYGYGLAGSADSLVVGGLMLAIGLTLALRKLWPARK